MLVLNTCKIIVAVAEGNKIHVPHASRVVRLVGKLRHVTLINTTCVSEGLCTKARRSPPVIVYLLIF